MSLRHIGLPLMFLAHIGALAPLLMATSRQSIAHGSQRTYMADASGRGADPLLPQEFEMAEGSRPNERVCLSGTAKIRPVDVVFVFDATESMQPYIDGIKSNMVSFVHTLAEGNRDPRFGLVTFEDYVISAQPDCGCPYRRNMASKVEEFISWLGTVHATGGGDIPEDSLDALAYASTFSFRPDADRFVILVTDAPNHKAGDNSSHTQHDQAYWIHHSRKGDVTNRTAVTVSSLLKRNNITLYAVAPPPFIAPDYAQIVRETNGQWYNIISNELRLPELVREIGSSIVNRDRREEAKPHA